jgi:hypothetical protein
VTAGLPQCAFPGCRARYDETLDGSYGSRPGLGRMTGWRWLDSEPEDPGVPAHEHALEGQAGPEASSCEACRTGRGQHDCGLRRLQAMFPLSPPRRRRQW